nr:vicilin-like seed storage protein At2g18540 [Procambarus clarkii]
MIDDFFDDDCGNDIKTSAAVKTFLEKNNYSRKTSAKYLSDIVNQTRKLALRDDNKDFQVKKETPYSESFEDDEKSGESKVTDTGSQTPESAQKQHSDTKTTKTDSEDGQEASKSQGTDETGSNQSTQAPPTSDLTLSKKTESQKLDDYSRSEVVSHPGASSDKSEDDEASINSEEQHERDRQLEVIKICSRKKELNERKLAEWLQKSRREAWMKKKERERAEREREEAEEEERERRSKEEEKKKKRVKEAMVEWHKKKRDEQRKEKIRMQQEAEEAERRKQKRAEESRRAYAHWKASNPRHARSFTCHAHTGDRLVPYYDRSTPTPPTYVNPQPWRRL